jgi:hypothetical protein
VGTRSCFSDIEYFLGIFGTRLNFKSLERVTYLGEVSEGSLVFRVLNEGPADVGNTESWFHISGGVVSIKVTVSQVSEMEKKYPGTLLRFKG